MLNWPGRNSKPPAGSISRVQTSAPSRCTWWTRSKRGSIGSTRSTVISARLAVDVEELEPRGLKAIDQDRYESHHHGVAEGAVGIALPSQAAGVDADGAHRLDRPRTRRPAV